MSYKNTKVKVRTPDKDTDLFDIVAGGARGVMVIVVGNEHGDTGSNPGRG